MEKKEENHNIARMNPLKMYQNDTRKNRERTWERKNERINRNKPDNSRMGDAVEEAELQNLKTFENLSSDGLTSESLRYA